MRCKSCDLSTLGELVGGRLFPEAKWGENGLKVDSGIRLNLIPTFTHDDSLDSVVACWGGAAEARLLAQSPPG